MANWFYVRDGSQTGPTSDYEIRRMLAAGELKPTDLGWREGMTDWKPLGELPEFIQPVTPPPINPNNPYAVPASTWHEPEPSAVLPSEEIEPGSVPLDVYACIGRAWELTKEHFGLILLTGLVVFAVSMAVEVPLSAIDVMLGGAQQRIAINDNAFVAYPTPAGVLHQAISQIVSIFLSLGTTRIGLNLVSGKPASIGMIFGEGQKLLRALGASILYGLMVFIGCVLLIVPGIYLAMRYGQFLHAIVDRDLGIMESFKYSSRLTTGNRGNLFLLAILFFLILIAGILALIVGLLAAMPITWLGSFIAYRWLQYGRRVLKIESPL